MSLPPVHPLPPLMLLAFGVGLVLTLLVGFAPFAGGYAPAVIAVAVVAFACFVVLFGLYWLGWLLREHERWRDSRRSLT
jgi:hypothetical protein